MTKPSVLWKARAIGPLEDSFCSRIKDHLRDHPGDPSYVLVGSNLLGLHLRKALARQGVGCFNLRFVTFVDLAKKILEQALFARQKRSLPRGAQALLLQQELSVLAPDHVFYELRDKEGFLSMLTSHFAQLIDYEEDGHEHIAGLYRRYRENYSQRFYHPSDLVSQAAHAQVDIAQTLGTNALFCYGFYDLTTIQKKLLEKCSEFLSLQVWFPKVNEGFLAPTAEGFFESIASQVNVLQGELAPKFECYSHAHPLAEAEDIARTIVQKKKNGESLSRMAVLLPKHELTDMYLEVLERAGIPYFLAGGRPLTGFAQGLGFAALLRHIKDGSGRRELMDALAHAELSPQKTQDIGAPMDWDFWTKASAQDAPEKFKLFLQDISGALEKLKAPCQTWSQASERWVAFLREYFSSHVVNQKIVEQLAGIADMEETGVMPTFANVWKIVFERIGSASLPTQRFESEAVYVGTAYPVRCVPFDTVFMPGFTQEVYPKKTFTHRWVQAKSAPEQDESLLYELIWRQAHHYIVSYPRKNLLHREVYPSSWIKSASPKPLLSWQQPTAIALDEGDWKQTNMAHRLLGHSISMPRKLSELSPLFGSVSNWVDQRLGSSVFGKYDGMLEKNKALARRYFSAKHIADFSKCPYQYFLRHIVKLTVTESPDDVHTIDRLDRGNMIHELLFQLFTGLKNQGAFPLRPSQRESVNGQLRQIAEQVFSQIERTKQTGLPALWEMEKTWIMQDLASFLEADFDEQAVYGPEAFEVRFGMPSRSQNEDQRYSTDEPMAMDVGEGISLSFYGKMDRIDVSADRRRIRVVDYKTGSIAHTKDDSFAAGQAVQLPIYLLAAKEIFADADLSQSEAVLMSTSFAGGFDRTYFSGNVLEARREEFHRLLATIYRMHSQGAFIPNPGQQQQNCGMCEFRPVCGKSIGRLFERKKSDPKIQPYLALEEIE